MARAESDVSLARAKHYSILKYAFSLSDTAFVLSVFFLFLYSGYAKVLARWVTLTVPFAFLALPAYVTIVFFVYYLLNLQSHFYQSFTLEHKFGLSNQALGSWAKDEGKSALLSYALSLSVIIALYRILAWFPRIWWLYAALFWIFFTLILAKLVPVLIIPLFFKYKKLSDEALRTRIIHLASRMEIPLLDCFEIDFSKKTLKANAACTGWGSTRRVILADTLKDTYSHDEIEVILAHEFAHYKLKHLLKLVVANAASTLLLFYLIYRTSSRMLHFFGMESLGDVAAFGILVIYVVIFGVIMQPLSNWISRVFERHADAMALQVTGKKEAFISMMEKLSRQNLSDPSPHPIIKWVFFSHPPASERIALAKRN